MKRLSEGTGPFWSAGRRAIGEACREGPRTRAELGRQLGVKPGSLESTLKALLREGVLEQTNVERTRGAAFQVRPKWRRALDRTVQAAHVAGRLTPGLRLLVVSAGPGLTDALAIAAVDPAVVWACRADGRARLVVATEATSVEQVDQVDRLESIFTGAGLDCIQLAITEVMTQPRLVEHARTVAGRPHPELQTAR
jgi:hypothetical protein